MERLQRVLAAAGIASRRKAEELIVEGRVRVDGVVVTELGTRVDAASQKVEVDGNLIPQERRRYIMLHKPSGYITTTDDERGRYTVMDLVQVTERVVPVGRLDRPTEGLLLLTNDGEVAFRITHPRFGVEKEYEALLDGHPPAKALDRIRGGILIDGERTVPEMVRPMRNTEDGTLVRIVIHEGRNRIVRRMFEEIGFPVLKLVRTRIGPLQLGTIPRGQWRDLSDGELEQLRQALHLDDEDQLDEQREKRTHWSERDQGGRRPAGQRPAGRSGGPGSGERRPRPQGAGPGGPRRDDRNAGMDRHGERRMMPRRDEQGGTGGNRFDRDQRGQGGHGQRPPFQRGAFTPERRDDRRPGGPPQRSAPGGPRERDERPWRPDDNANLGPGPQRRWEGEPRENPAHDPRRAPRPYEKPFVPRGPSNDQSGRRVFDNQQRNDRGPRQDGPRRDWNQAGPPRGPRPDGPRQDGPRRDWNQAGPPRGPRPDGPRQDGPRRDWNQAGPPRGPRPDGPRQDGPRRDWNQAGPPRGPRPDGPRQDGPRRDWNQAGPPRGPRPDGPRQDGPRRDWNQAGPPRGPRPDGPRRDFGPRNDGPRRDFGPGAPRQDGPRRDFGPRNDGPRRDFGPRQDGPRNDGPRRDFGPRQDGPRPGAPGDRGPRPFDQRNNAGPGAPRRDWNQGGPPRPAQGPAPDNRPAEPRREPSAAPRPASQPQPGRSLRRPGAGGSSGGGGGGGEGRQWKSSGGPRGPRSDGQLRRNADGGNADNGSSTE